MVISAYQVNNVLRVYGDQLRQGKMSHRLKTDGNRTPDRISISNEAKRNAIIDRIASNVLDRVTRYGLGDKEQESNMERLVFDQLQNQYGKQLLVDKTNGSEFIFKEIDEDGETVNALSIEDSQFLTHKLKNIIQQTVDTDVL